MRHLNPVSHLRHLGLTEGASLLVLLLIAMLLKYGAGMPTAVKIVGWIHGALFVAFYDALLWRDDRRPLVDRTRGSRIRRGPHAVRPVSAGAANATRDLYSRRAGD